MNLNLILMIAGPVLAVLSLAVLMYVAYRFGIECGEQNARARHALRRLEENRAKRARPAWECP